MSKLEEYRSERDIIEREFVETKKELTRMQESMSILTARSKRLSVQLQTFTELIDILENARPETIAPAGNC